MNKLTTMVQIFFDLNLKTSNFIGVGNIKLLLKLMFHHQKQSNHLPKWQNQNRRSLETHGSLHMSKFVDGKKKLVYFGPCQTQTNNVIKLMLCAMNIYIFCNSLVGFTQIILILKMLRISKNKNKNNQYCFWWRKIIFGGIF